MNKNKKLLQSFVEYCEKNPELRFWQALRNWSGYNWVLVSKSKKSLENMEWEDLDDTFYLDFDE